MALRSIASERWNGLTPRGRSKLERTPRKIMRRVSKRVDASRSDCGKLVHGLELPAALATAASQQGRGRRFKSYRDRRSISQRPTSARAYFGGPE